MDITLASAALGAVSSLIAALISFFPWFNTTYRKNALAVVVLIVASFVWGGFHYTTLAAFWDFFLHAAVYAVTTYVFVVEQPVKALKNRVNQQRAASGKPAIY